VNTSLKKQEGGFALGFVVGLLVGLVAALGVALYVTKTPVPLMNKGQQHTPEQDAAEAERNKSWDPNAALTGKQAARPVAPAAPTVAASDTAVVPRTPGPVLPPPVDTAKATPPSAATKPDTPKSTRDAAAILAGADAGDAAKPAASAADPYIYFVQVGAYSKPEDAEQQRARLALAGLRATVSDREQNGRTVHRVRLGPFDRKDEADAQTDRAKAVDPDASLVRVERSKQ
jgi:cell division protein FtsN